MAILACEHPEELVRQIGPTKHLLSNLHTEHPDLLLAKGIRPDDYERNMVFRSAIESIRGTFAATTSVRSAFVNGILEGMKQAKHLSDWQSIGGKGRCDYNVQMKSPRKKWNIAIEGKGGEGNSFNIGDRPNWSDEYIVWGHLDGAIVHQPAHGAASNLYTRLSAEIVGNLKKVECYLVLDRFCGTPIRPCPKLKGGIGHPPPCVFLMPKDIPTADMPCPRRAAIDDVEFVNRMMRYFGVPVNSWHDHIRQVRIQVYRKTPALGRKEVRPYRRVSVFQHGTLVEQKEIPITRGARILKDVPRLKEGSYTDDCETT